MDQNNERELRRLLEEIRRTSGAMGDFSQAFRDAEEASERQRRTVRQEEERTRKSFLSGLWKSASDESRNANERINSKIMSVRQDLEAIGRDTNEALHQLRHYTTGFLGLGTVSWALTEYASNLIRTYQDLASAGSSFADGLIGMSSAAAAGGMTLDEFARAARENAVALAQFKGGATQFAQLTKNVREVTSEFGNYGYTISGLNDLAGAYLETQRLQGHLGNLDTQRARDQLVRLAETTSALSIAMGKSREELTRQAQEALRYTTFATAMQDTSAMERESFQNVATLLAAQPGEIGGMLSKFFAETVGVDGQANLTQTAQSIFNQVAPGVTMLMADLVTAAREADTIEEQVRLQNEFIEAARAEIAPQIDTLRIMAELGDQAARQTLDFYNQTQKLDVDKYRTSLELAQQQEQLTNALLKAQNDIYVLFGDMRLVLLRGLNEVVGAFFEFKQMPEYQRMMEAFGVIGSSIKSITMNLLRFVGVIDEGGSTIGDFTIDALKGLTVAAELAASGFNLVANVVDWFMNDSLAWLGDKFQTLGDMLGSGFLTSMGSFLSGLEGLKSFSAIGLVTGFIKGSYETLLDITGGLENFLDNTKRILFRSDAARQFWQSMSFARIPDLINQGMENLPAMSEDGFDAALSNVWAGIKEAMSHLPDLTIDWINRIMNHVFPGSDFQLSDESEQRIAAFYEWSKEFFDKIKVAVMPFKDDVMAVVDFFRAEFEAFKNSNILGEADSLFATIRTTISNVQDVVERIYVALGILQPGQVLSFATTIEGLLREADRFLTGLNALANGDFAGFWDDTLNNFIGYMAAAFAGKSLLDLILSKISVGALVNVYGSVVNVIGGGPGGGPGGPGGGPGGPGGGPRRNPLARLFGWINNNPAKAAGAVAGVFAGVDGIMTYQQREAEISAQVEAGILSQAEADQQLRAEAVDQGIEAGIETAGAIAGAVIGSIGGPLGSALGGYVGTVAGEWAGNAIGDTVKNFMSPQIAPEIMNDSEVQAARSTLQDTERRLSELQESIPEVIQRRMARSGAPEEWRAVADEIRQLREVARSQTEILARVQAQASRRIEDAVNAQGYSGPVVSPRAQQ